MVLQSRLAGYTVPLRARLLMVQDCFCNPSAAGDRYAQCLVEYYYLQLFLLCHFWTDRGTKLLMCFLPLLPLLTVSHDAQGAKMLWAGQEYDHDQGKGEEPERFSSFRARARGFVSDVRLCRRVFKTTQIMRPRTCASLSFQDDVALMQAEHVRAKQRGELMNGSPMRLVELPCCLR